MNKEDKIYLSDLNLAEYTREMTRWNAEGEIIEQQDLLLTRGKGNFPTTSVALNLSPTNKGAGADLFDRIQSFYKNRESAFSIHIRGHADTALETVCQQENLISISDAPGMVVDHPLKKQSLPDGLELRPINTVAGVADFAFVTRESYQSLGMPAYVGDQIFATPERLLRPHNYLVVAYDASRPVSAAMIMYSHGIAGIYWVGTLESARGKGLAEACVRNVVSEAFTCGARLVVLQASKFGAPLYRKMGFEEVTHYPWYIYFKPS